MHEVAPTALYVPWRHYCVQSVRPLCWVCREERSYKDACGLALIRVVHLASVTLLPAFRYFPAGQIAQFLLYIVGSKPLSQQQHFSAQLEPSARVPLAVHEGRQSSSAREDMTHRSMNTAHLDMSCRQISD
eukprot:496944-Hanusia_phi.AAC.1